MRVVGVIDLLDGRAVHAVRGERHHYRPLATSGGIRIDGDPMALAALYHGRFGLTELYVADLDAIAGGPVQRGVVRSLAAAGVSLWLDAGVSSVAAARHALNDGATRVIVGLETLRDFDHLSDISTALGSEHVAFSLDLRDGIPVACEPTMARERPAAIAARAASCVGAIVLIDLARVGSRRGVDLTTVAMIRKAAGRVTLLVGGGIRTQKEIDALADAGCDGVLVATAIHTGTLKAAAN